MVSKIADHPVGGEIAGSRSWVFILAPGRMGKTSTALAVMKYPSVMKKSNMYCVDDRERDRKVDELKSKK